MVVCVCVCVCVCVRACSIVSDSVPEQWHMGVCMCVCVHAQSCLILCSEAVAYGCVCVHSVVSNFLHQSSGI